MNGMKFSSNFHTEGSEAGHTKTRWRRWTFWEACLRDQEKWPHSIWVGHIDLFDTPVSPSQNSFWHSTVSAHVHIKWLAIMRVAGSKHYLLSLGLHQQTRTFQSMLGISTSNGEEAQPNEIVSYDLANSLYGSANVLFPYEARAALVLLGDAILER